MLGSVPRGLPRQTCNPKVTLTRLLPNGHLEDKLQKRAAGIPTALAKAVTLKYTPQLVFHLDDSIERGARVFEILQQIETPKEQ